MLKNKKGRPSGLRSKISSRMIDLCSLLGTTLCCAVLKSLYSVVNSLHWQGRLSNISTRSIRFKTTFKRSLRERSACPISLLTASLRRERVSGVVIVRPCVDILMISTCRVNIKLYAWDGCSLPQIAVGPRRSSKVSRPSNVFSPH